MDGSKARLRLSDTAASFHLNSSLVPGHLFSCHLELSVDPANSGDKKMSTSTKGCRELNFKISGILVYFDSMKLAEPTSGESLEQLQIFHIFLQGSARQTMCSLAVISCSSLPTAATSEPASAQ